MKYKIKCPLCNEEMVYKKISNSMVDIMGNTHIWICPNCPFIGLEFYDNYNAKALANYLITNK